MKGHVEINRAENKQFIVIYIAANSQVLSYTETFKTRASVKKNILAMMKIFEGSEALVHDVIKDQWYTLWASGVENFSLEKNTTFAIKKRQH